MSVKIPNNCQINQFCGVCGFAQSEKLRKVESTTQTTNGNCKNVFQQNDNNTYWLFRVVFSDKNDHCKQMTR